MVSLVRFSFWPAHHPRGMKAISPGSRSASGVGRPRPVSDPEGVAAQCAANPPGSVCRTTSRHRWWRCAYHRLIAANPPGLSHGTKTAPVNQIVLPLVLAAHTPCAVRLGNVWKRPRRHTACAYYVGLLTSSARSGSCRRRGRRGLPVRASPIRRERWPSRSRAATSPTSTRPRSSRTPG